MGDAGALFRSLLDHTDDGIEVIDPETGRFIDVNRRACTTHGYTREEYLGMCVVDVDPMVAEEGWPVSRARIIERGSYLHSGRHRRKDRTEFDVEVNATYVVDDRSYILAIVRDVTDRRRAERALAESHEQLRQAQKMEAVGRLAAGIAHDFNNLLTVINGNIESVLASISESNPNHELLADVAEAGRRGATLTRQLLAFSRKQVLLPRVVDLNDLLRDILQLLRRVIGEDIDARLVEAPSLGGVRIDPGQFEQAIVNLVVNARDAMPRGGRLTITTERMSAPNDPCVSVRVTDSGTGMDEATKARIFDPFFTTKETGRGTGLGLAMVYGFVEQSGGRIEVESAPGRGTTFAIHLPLVLEALSTPLGLPEVKTDPSRGDETVLLVEDDVAVRRLVKRTLSARGYTVLSASDAEQAIELARAHPQAIDILVTDLVMPGLSGRELAETLTGERPQLRTLFMSGYIDPRLLVSPDHLQKPFGANELALRIRLVLDR